MADAANKWTDEQLAVLEKRMRKEYSQALREIKAKQKRFMADYAKEKAMREKALDDTPEAMQAHQAWLEQQAYRSRWADDMVEELSWSATHAKQRAMALLNDETPVIYAENANYAAYSVDRAAGVNTMFNLVDESTVRELMKSDVELIPQPSVDVAKELRWNRKHFTSAITQGILQGESIPDISKRLMGALEMDYRSARMVARMAVTAAENQGRVSSYKRAKDMGIGLKQEWLATLDGRTRHSHRQLDGERVEVGEKFSNGCRFPGDPQGRMEEICNCRCTLVAAVDGFETDDAERWSNLPKDTSYERWKNEKSESGLIAGSGLGASGGPSGNREWLKQFEPEVASVTVGGTEIYRKAGTPNSCVFPETLPNGLRYEDVHLMHTHTTPVAGTFSDIDIDVTARTFCASHTVRQELEGKEYTLTRTPQATRESALKFRDDFASFYRKRKDDAEFALWLEEYANAGIALDDVGRRRVLKALQPEYDSWLKEHAASYDYEYKTSLLPADML